jgi:hypothetical protein
MRYWLRALAHPASVRLFFTPCACPRIPIRLSALSATEPGIPRQLEGRYGPFGHACPPGHWGSHLSRSSSSSSSFSSSSSSSSSTSTPPRPSSTATAVRPSAQARNFFGFRRTSRSVIVAAVPLARIPSRTLARPIRSSMASLTGLRASGAPMRIARSRCPRAPTHTWRAASGTD